MKRISVFFLAVSLSTFLLSFCSKDPTLESPHKIGSKKRHKIISGREAIKVIDQMHGLSVAPNVNIIVEYGKNNKDILYISYYDDTGDAQKYLRLMIEKMETAKNSRFKHIMPLPEYGSSVYFALGIGAIHYIYCSSNYILWLQTNQTFGRNLPEELLTIYPISEITNS